jgi:hypothetical protein
MAVVDQFLGSHCVFSHPVPDEEIQDCSPISLIPIRRSNAYQDAGRIIASLTQDWTATIGGGDEDNPDYHACENTISGCFDSLILPESSPDRFELTVWFTQFFFLLDGKTLIRIAHSG